MLKVSVIIPTYNRADYLAQALQSVFDQSLSPFEVLVIDDGSSDGTADLVRGWQPAVRYLWQDHKGVSAARNLGLDEAQGQVVAWLDADDLWESHFLESTIDLLAEDQELDGVYSGCIHIDAGGNILPQSSNRVVPPSELYWSLIDGNFIATPSIVVRKECYDRVDRFDPDLGICEDYDMWLRLASEFTIAGLAVPLVRIRIHDSNTMGDIAAFSRFRLALVQKHFGSPEGDPSTWPEAKRRAYAQAYREVAFRYSRSSEAAERWQYIEKAVAIWPELLGQLKTFYEIACGDEPRGYRGQATVLDLEANGREMLQELDTLFLDAKPALVAMRPTAYGNAHLALAMLHDQAGNWAAARRHLRQAVRSNPRLLASYPVLRRLLKLHAGQRMVNLVRRPR
jgi:glycosyltransferase involved in cell wall biosynthesis